MAAALRFDDPARQSQMVFRAVMTAMSRPGRIEAIATLHARGSPPRLHGRDRAGAVRFRDAGLARSSLACGCRRCGMVPVSDGQRRLWSDRTKRRSPLWSTPTRPLSSTVLVLGTEEYPERSTTLVLNVDRLSDEGGFSLIGPGVKGAARLGVHPVRPGLIAERAGLFELFPRGVDLIFVCGARIAALPRTTIVEG